MAKFEELNKNLGPLQEIAAQMYPLIRLVYDIHSVYVWGESHSFPSFNISSHVAFVACYMYKG